MSYVECANCRKVDKDGLGFEALGQVGCKQLERILRSWQCLELVQSAEFQELTLWSTVGTLSRRSQSVVEIVVDLHWKGVRKISGTGVRCG